VLITAFIIAAASILLGIHPFITYPLSLLLARKQPLPDGDQQKRTGDRVPSVAICMSVFNEERVIAVKMDSLLAMAAAYPGAVSVNVFVDGASDSTPQILAAYQDRANIVLSKERRGKTWGMTHLVSQTDSDLLMFTDANVVSGDEALVGLSAPFRDPSVGLTSARLRYNNSEESVTSKSGAAYWEIEEAIKRIESQTVGLVGVDGAMFMIRRSLYQAPPPHLIDDLYVSLGVLIAEKRIISVDSVVVYERSAALAGEEFNRKRRIACQAWNVHRTLWPQLRKMSSLRLYSYISHRVLKWFMPLFVMITGLSILWILAILIGFEKVGFLTLGGILAIYIAYLLKFKPASMILSIAYSLFGVASGISEAIFTSKTYTIWLPANSVRAEPSPDEQSAR